MTSAERRAAQLWARADLRERWQSFVAIGVLFGLAGALGAALVSGARRTETAYDRFHEAANGGDALVLGSEAGIRDLDWPAIVERPEVASAVAYGVMGQDIQVAGEPERDVGLSALAPDAPAGLFTTVEVPQLIEGRLADPNRVDEAVINTVAHRMLGIDIGDVLILKTQTESADDPDAFDGPVFRLQVVGIGAVPLSFIRFPGRPLVFPTGEVLGRHDEIVHGSDLIVRLRHGSADVPGLRAALSEEFGTDVPVLDLRETASRVRHGTTFEQAGLLLLAAGVALVGLSMAAQTLARAVDQDEQAVVTLSALGMPRRVRTLALALPAAVAAGVALLVLTLVGAAALSPRFPIGLARQLEPDIGVHLDWPVFAGASVFLLTTMAGAATVGAWSASSNTRRAAAGKPPTRPMGLWRARWPLVVDLGVRLAIEPPDRAARSPMRPVVLAAVLGLLGVVATATVAVGLDDALASPGRSGQHWEGMYFPEDPPALERQLLGRSDVLGVARASYAKVSSNGIPVAAFAFDPVTGPASFTVRSGRAPRTPDEVMLGVAIANRLSLGVGGDFVLAVSGDSATLRVVGTGLVPQALGSAYDEGAWVTPQGMERVGELSLFGEAADALFVDFSETVTRAEIDQFPSDQGLLPNQLEAESQVVTNLRGIRRLPVIEGAFFVVLTLGSIGHLLRTTSRRRRGDFGLLRAIGFTRRQTLAAVTWQGITLGIISLVLGVPLGIAAGRWVWHAMASATSLVDVGPLPSVVLAVVAPLTVVTTGLLAFGSARRTVRHLLTGSDADAR